MLGMTALLLGASLIFGCPSAFAFAAGAAKIGELGAPGG
jgi:hypothetical protein